LVILGWNGHLVEPECEAAVNDRLGHLRTAIWTSATALRHELR
jgi:biotin operon repressor